MTFRIFLGKQFFSGEEEGIVAKSKGGFYKKENLPQSQACVWCRKMTFREAFCEEKGCVSEASKVAWKPGKAEAKFSKRSFKIKKLCLYSQVFRHVAPAQAPIRHLCSGCAKAYCHRMKFPKAFYGEKDCECFFRISVIQSTNARLLTMFIN